MAIISTANMLLIMETILVFLLLAGQKYNNSHLNNKNTKYNYDSFFEQNHSREMAWQSLTTIWDYLPS